MKTIVDYAQLVKQQHALNISLAPVEADPTASSKAYAIGQHFILDGELYKAKTAIALGDALVLDTNYEAAGSIEAQIETLDAENQTLTNNVDGNWSNGGKNILDYYAWKKVTTYISRGTAVWENNGISITATGDDAYCNAAYHVPVKEGNTYCLSWEENSNKSGAIYVFPNGLSTGMVTVNNSAAKSLNYTVGAGITFITFRFGVATNGDTISYKNIQIEQGNSATPYVPYAKTNRELTGDIEPMLNVLGAKNLLKNTASSATVNGITFTVNSDGSVTANGTATANASLIVGRYEFKANQNVILSGCPSTGSQDTYKLLSWPTTAPSSGGRQKEDIGQGVLLDYPDNLTCQIQIFINNGQVLNNITFYPMIRPASIEDDTYVPYAMTNRELTEVKSYTINASTYANAFGFRKIGNVVQVQLPAIKNDIPVATTVTIGNLPSDLIPLVNSQFQSEDPATGSNAVRYNFTAEGVLTIYRYSGTVGTGTLMNVGGTGVYLTK